MKNTECTIYITTKHGWTQSYRKEKNGWTQTGPNGIVRPLSAEQLLSHILPPLAAGNPDHLSVRVEPDVILAPLDRIAAQQPAPADPKRTGAGSDFAARNRRVLPEMAR
jgi:hypothetical protein